MSNKRLYKSTVNCMLCGVCGGIAEGCLEKNLAFKM